MYTSAAETDPSALVRCAGWESIIPHKGGTTYGDALDAERQATRPRHHAERDDYFGSRFDLRTFFTVDSTLPSANSVTSVAPSAKEDTERTSAPPASVVKL